MFCYIRDNEITATILVGKLDPTGHSLVHLQERAFTLTRTGRTARATSQLTCCCCCSSSSWLDLGTKECNVSSLRESAPLSLIPLQVLWQLSRYISVHPFPVRPYGQIGKPYRYSGHYGRIMLYNWPIWVRVMSATNTSNIINTLYSMV